MSVNLIPGYDFTPYEIVTTEKLRKWIAGTHNSGTLQASDIGLSSDDTGIGLFTTATWATTVSPGALTLNRTTGWVTVSTRWGHVPVFGTQGGLFSMRLKEGESSRASFDRFYEGSAPNMIGVKVAHTPTLPASSYSAGEGFDLFGANSLNVGAAFMAASDISAHRAGKTFARYPSANSYNNTGAWTASTYVTGTSFVHSLYKLGGYQTLRYGLESIGATEAQIASISFVESWSPGVQINNLELSDTDNENHLAFGGGRDSGVRSWYFLNATSHSLVDSNAVAGEGAGSIDVVFDPDTRLLYSAGEDGEGLSVFEVDTTGNLTFLSNYSNVASADAIIKYDNHVYISANDMYFFDVSVATAPTLIQKAGVATGLVVKYCAFARDHNFIISVDQDDTQWRHVHQRHPGGTLTYLGVTYDAISSYPYALETDNENDNIVWEASTTAGLRVIECNSAGSLTLLNTINNTAFTLDFFYDYVCVADSNNGVKVYNKSSVTDVTLIYSAQPTTYAHAIAVIDDNLMVSNDDVSDVWNMFDLNTVTSGSGTGVSGIRGYSDGVVWDIAPSTNSAVSGPMRVTPAAQCFYYYGTKQLSGGYVIPALSVNEFTLGGSEF